MKVVIDIDEQEFHKMKDLKDYYNRDSNVVCRKLALMIKNGTPLQEHCESCCPYYPTESEDD